MSPRNGRQAGLTLAQHDNVRALFGFLAGIALALCGALNSSGAVARQMPLQNQVTMHYELQDESLLTFLRRFFSDQGLRVVISDKLQSDRRTLNGPRTGTAAGILRSIIDSNGLLTYYDGTSVYVYRADEAVHQYLPVAVEKAEALELTLDRMRLSDRDNSARISQETGLVEVNGAPQYLRQIRQLVAAVSENAQSVHSVFRYIPLKYAWATDRSFRVADHQVTVPGVANILWQVIHGQGKAVQQFGGVDTGLSARVESLRGHGLSAFSSQSQATTADPMTTALSREQGQYPANDNEPSSATSIAVVDNEDKARIVADPYHNALIIRDLPERIPLYEDLVHTLDVPTDLVEIEATIIDINTDKLRDLGVEWRFGRDHGEALFANPGSKTNFLDALAGDSVAALDQLPGFQLGAIVGNKNQFIARLNTLEQQGVVKVASRPKVATLNDLEAVIESSRSLYVPVKGAYDVDLFQVYSGTVLRVVPHIINDGETTRIRMVITVEDGNVELQSGVNETIPATTRNAVNTQAIVDAGHSLLLGGLVRDEDNSQTSKVPWLGDIPLLGRLFRSDSDKHQRSERLFLISPRLVTPDGTYRQSDVYSQSRALGQKLSPDVDAALSALDGDGSGWVQQPCKASCREEYGSHALHFF